MEGGVENTPSTPTPTSSPKPTRRPDYTPLGPESREGEGEYDALYPPDPPSRHREGYSQLTLCSGPEEDYNYVVLDPRSTLHTHTGARSDGDAGSGIRAAPSEAYDDIVDQSRSMMAEGAEVFVSTGSFRAASATLQQQGLLLVTGPPGTGKTALGHALLRDMAGRGYTPLVLCDWLEWSRHVTPDRQLVVLLDGAWGEVRLHDDWWRTWGSLVPSFPQMTSQRQCLLIVTAYPHIVKEIESSVKMQECLREVPTVHLASADPFPAMEKELMLCRHLARLGVSADSQAVREVTESERCGPLFPWCCERLAVQLSQGTGRLQPGAIALLPSPALAHVALFTAMLQDDRFLPLLAIVMRGQADVIGHVQDAMTELGSLGLRCEAGRVAALPVLSGYLRGSVLSEDGLSFSSREVYVGLGLAMYGAGFTHLLLNACDALFLVNHVTTHTHPRPPGLLITPTSPHLPAFVRRVARDLWRGRVVEVSQHPSLHHPGFLGELEGALRGTGPVSRALSLCDADHALPLLYWAAWAPPPSHTHPYDNRGAGLSLTQWCLQHGGPGGGQGEGGRVLRQALLLCCVLGERVDTPRVAAMLDRVCEDVTLLNDVMAPVTLPLPPARLVLTEALRARCEAFSASRPPRLVCGKPSLSEAADRDCCLPPHIISLHVQPAVQITLTPRCVRWYTALRLLTMVEVEERNREGYSLLHTAAFTGDLPVVTYLASRGASLTATTRKGNTPFSKAVQANKLQVAAYLLSTGHSLQELSGRGGVGEMLRGVVANRQADMLRLLLDQGALQVTGSRDHRWLLQEAGRVKGNGEVVKVLRSHGVTSRCLLPACCT